MKSYEQIADSIIKKHEARTAGEKSRDAQPDEVTDLEVIERRRSIRPLHVIAACTAAAAVLAGSIAVIRKLGDIAPVRNETPPEIVSMVSTAPEVSGTVTTVRQHEVIEVSAVTTTSAEAPAETGTDEPVQTAAQTVTVTVVVTQTVPVYVDDEKDVQTTAPVQSETSAAPAIVTSVDDFLAAHGNILLNMDTFQIDFSGFDTSPPPADTASDPYDLIANCAAVGVSAETPTYLPEGLYFHRMYYRNSDISKEDTEEYDICSTGTQGAYARGMGITVQRCENHDDLLMKINLGYFDVGYRYAVLSMCETEVNGHAAYRFEHISSMDSDVIITAVVYAAGNSLFTYSFQNFTEEEITAVLESIGK